MNRRPPDHLGVDIVNDGEYARAGSYGGYIQGRVTGYSTVPVDPNKPPKRASTRWVAAPRWRLGGSFFEIAVTAASFSARAE